jgi:hypothetical protein
MNAQIGFEIEGAESPFKRTPTELLVLLTVTVQMGGLGIDVGETPPGYPDVTPEVTVAHHESLHLNCCIKTPRLAVRGAKSAYLRNGDNAQVVSPATLNLNGDHTPAYLRDVL